MEKLLSDVQQIILNEDKLILVLVLAEDCMEHETGLEHELRPLVENCDTPVRVMRVCFDTNNMPWPRPLTECVYYFAPKKFNPLFLRAGLDVIRRFEDDVKIASKMMNGLSYDEASFDEEGVELINKTEEMFDEENVDEFPPTTQMLRNFAKDMWKSAKSAGKGLPVLVSAEEATNRFSICEQCPKLTDNFRCTECGCFMKKKSQLVEASCPLGKW